MNNVQLIGRLTAEPQMRKAGDHDIAAFSLAVDRNVAKGSTGQSVDFIDVMAWNKRAEFAERYLHKGMKIAITGRIQTGSYKNKDGNTVRTFCVVAEDMEFCEKKESSSGTTTVEQDFMMIGIGEELPFN